MMHMQMQTKKTIPSWEELCFHLHKPLANSLSKKLTEEIQSIKGSPPRLTGKLAKLFLFLFAKDRSTRKYLHVEWGEVVDIFFDQLLRNRWIRDQLLEPQESHGSLYTNRVHSQLPCTKHTTKIRVEEAKKKVKLTDPILLIGDDDFVGIELCRAGFTDVTSIDIDPNICHQLYLQAKEENLKIKIALHDISNPPPEDLVRDYKFVYMDPMYTIDGINLFLKSAKQFTGNSAGYFIFLSFHVLSLLKKDTKQFDHVLHQQGFEILDFRSGFNSYPIPEMWGKLIRTAVKIFVKTSLLEEDPNLFRFFTSDAMLLRNIGLS